MLPYTIIILIAAAATLCVASKICKKHNLAVGVALIPMILVVIALLIPSVIQFNDIRGEAECVASFEYNNESYSIYHDETTDEYFTIAIDNFNMIVHQYRVDLDMEEVAEYMELYNAMKSIELLDG